MSLAAHVTSRSWRYYGEGQGERNGLKPGRHAQGDWGNRIMKRAYCSECKSYVLLDENESCPGGHRRSSYRDVGDVDAPRMGDYSKPSVQHSKAAGSAAAAPPKGSGVSSPRQRTPKPWLWIAAAVLALLGLSAVAVVTVFLPRFTDMITDLSSASVATPYPPLLVASEQYVAPTPEQQRWALATCAVLTQANGERHDTLAGCDQTPDNVEIAGQVLSGSWGITNREELLATLTSLENGGHRRDFDALTSIVASSTPEDLDALRKRVSNDPVAASQLELAVARGGELSGKSIAGWDYGRYVFLCRRGYLCGYLTEEEAWSRIMPVARALQATFSSWQELGENYLVGRQYWQGERAIIPDQFADARDALLTDPASPWLTLPWDLDLSAQSDAAAATTPSQPAPAAAPAPAARDRGADEAEIAACIAAEARSSDSAFVGIENVEYTFESPDQCTVKFDMVRSAEPYRVTMGADLEYIGGHWQY